MRRSKSSIIVYAIIGLALLGIISQLFTNPMSFLKEIFMIIGVGVVLFSVVYLMFFRNRRGTNSNEMKKYKQAVKQSQQKYKTTNPQQTTASKQNTHTQSKKRNHQRTAHLRVIDGNRDKSKRKNRATF